MNLCEQVFQKMEYVYHPAPLKSQPDRKLWIGPDGTNILQLPLIDSQWEVCVRYLVPFMEKKMEMSYSIYASTFLWVDCDGDMVSSEKIKKHNIALACCESFLKLKLE